MKAILLLLALSGLVSAEFNSKIQGKALRRFEIQPGRGGRIVNGYAAGDNQFPHQALLIINGNTQCGGSLVHPLWLVTAAHCTNGIQWANAYFGSTNRNAMTLLKYAVYLVNINTGDDISMLKLDSAIAAAANIKPIALPTGAQATASYDGSVLIASGFGGIATGGLADHLQWTYLRGISVAECQSVYGSGITANVLCTRGYPNANQGTCGGDSGGPLITTDANPVLVGVVSFGAAAGCDLGYPQGFVRVTNFIDFINGVIANF
jgi:secreted trypsin-like serine protease